MEKKEQELNIYEQTMINCLKETLGGEQKAFFYADESEENRIDILFAKGSPANKYITASTLGLVNRATGYEDKETGKEIRAEIIMSGPMGTDLTGRILATLGKGIIDTNVRYGYGTVFKDIINLYYPESEMKHVFLMLPPPKWQKEFTVTECEGCLITFLYALPVSDEEMNYMDEKGIVALQDLFVEKNINMFDPERKSVI